MIQTIVTDIEGTTTSIDFVYRVLFPYAREHIGKFLTKRWEDPDVRPLLEDVVQAEGAAFSVSEVRGIVQRWMAEDRKETLLKAIQGLIWAEGYAKGDLCGHVYPDVPVCLRRWHDRGMTLHVYSSGSEYAQRLIFSNTEFGDLTPLFSSYFDTRVGSKRDVESYKMILNRLARPAHEVLFLSDVGQELDAARMAGLQTCQLVRDARTGHTDSHPLARNFLEVESVVSASFA